MAIANRFVLHAKKLLQKMDIASLQIIGRKVMSSIEQNEVIIW